MGRGSREKPAKLGGKLALIRKYLGLSQDGLVRAFRVTRKLTRNDISKYERGIREPPLAVLLRYARVAKVDVEVIIDDDLELPRAFGHGITRTKQSSKLKRQE